MRTIHFESRSLFICNENEKRVKDPDEIISINTPEDKLPEIIDTIDNNKNIKSLVLITDDVEKTYNLIRKQFTEINAAGGLVKNKDNKYLLIFRNGKWDLSKGKQEKGEDIRLTAQREVSEECGITAPEAGDLICITEHTYHRNGFILKHTYWYKMDYRLSEELVPQTEEGIEKLEWVAPENLKDYIGNTYPSIRDVLSKAGLI